MLKNWDDLPDFIRVPEVKPYYDVLSRRRVSLLLKRIFDYAAALVLLLVLSPLMFFIALAIRIDSAGDVFYRQIRITSYGKEFRIHKFRTMVSNAEQIGSSITVNGDSRVTRIGIFLRRTRLDELPQLLDILAGNMSFVGTRPEIPKYVRLYTPEMRATLLLPAGITSETSIRYKDEEMLLSTSDDIDRVYMEQILPEKMRWNLRSIQTFSFLHEILVMIRTVIAVTGKSEKKISGNRVQNM